MEAMAGCNITISVNKGWQAGAMNNLLLLDVYGIEPFVLFVYFKERVRESTVGKLLERKDGYEAAMSQNTLFTNTLPRSALCKILYSSL